MANTPFGEWTELRILRERSNWKLTPLAEKAGIGKGYLSDLENGKRWPTAAVIKKLSEALNVPYTMLERHDAPAATDTTEERQRRGNGS